MTRRVCIVPDCAKLYLSMNHFGLNPIQFNLSKINHQQVMIQIRWTQFLFMVVAVLFIST